MTVLTVYRSSPIFRGMTSLDYALRYASMGWPLFRVWGARDGKCVCEMAPPDLPTRKDHSGGKGSPGKHPVVGQSEATADEGTIRSWFAGAFEPGIAMACGPKTGVWVLDVDPRNGGHETLAKLLETHGPLPETAAVKTGGGGLHLFFKWPGDRVTRWPKTLGPGLDVIVSAAPYVILPPSTHVSGATYEWLRPPWDLAPAPVAI